MSARSLVLRSLKHVFLKRAEEGGQLLAAGAGRGQGKGEVTEFSREGLTRRILAASTASGWLNKTRPFGMFDTGSQGGGFFNSFPRPVSFNPPALSLAKGLQELVGTRAAEWVLIAGAPLRSFNLALLPTRLRSVFACAGTGAPAAVRVVVTK